MKTYLMRFKNTNATHVLVQTDERMRTEIGYYKKQNDYWSAYVLTSDSRDWEGCGIYTTHQKARQAIINAYKTKAREANQKFISDHIEFVSVK